LILAFDIEGDQLYPHVSKLWVLVAQDVDTKKQYVFRGNEQMAAAVELLNSAKAVVAHNGTWFDRPALEKISGRKLTAPLIDTLVWSRLAYSDAEAHPIGGNGIEDWGRFLHKPKKEFNDYSAYSPEMEEYCIRDVEICVGAYKHLLPKMRLCPQASRTEHRVSEIIFRQWCNGVRLNIDKCLLLHSKLESMVLEALRLCQERVPPWEVPLKTKVKLVPFNPGSRPQAIKYFIQKYGWVPTVKTEKGNPSLSEAVLESLPYDEAEWIMDFLHAQKRVGMTQSYLDTVGADGIIHGEVNTNGAITGRMTHSNPNLAQVPKIVKDKVRGILKGREGNWGYDFRDLFEPTRPGWSMVGWDASSLELRMLANRLAPYDGGEYIKLVTEGDVHTHNQMMCGCKTRDQAKTVIYATIYGAGDEKLAKTLGVSVAEARRIKIMLKTNVKGFAAFEKEVRDEMQATGGYIRGIDGRMLHVRSDHLILNTALQSDGAVVMKNALVHCNQLEQIQRGRAYFMLNVHDEIQTESESDHDTFGKAMVECIKEAQHDVGIKCPLAGEYKHGVSWANTH